MSNFGEKFDAMMREAGEYLRTEDKPLLIGEPGPELNVRRLGAFVPVSCCVMTDTTGQNHCNHPLPPRPAWHRRLRWRVRGWISRQRMRLGSWIAGVDLDREDW